MIQAVIVDDEKSAQEDLLSCIADYCAEVEVLAACSTVAEAYKKITELKPELVFLDVNLGNKTSFDLLEFFDHISFKIIFVTGYDQYALRAIKCSALDYILKPFDELDVVKAVEKAKNSIQYDQQIKLLKEHFLHKEESKRIALYAGGEIVLVQTKEIVNCQSDGNFSWVFTMNQKYHTSHPLKELQELLSKESFFRVHKSHLINLQHIHKYTLRDGGEISMKNDKKVPLSDIRKADFLKKINR